jgi:hypothetical protein
MLQAVAWTATPARLQLWPLLSAQSIRKLVFKMRGVHRKALLGFRAHGGIRVPPSRGPAT